ncbi:spermidine synthase [Lewinella sp. LCG006]|uniref:spermidine synthase n=1 Tax=Lewinella sp. LCG006 TaxID=3231911 RepID=UPI003460C0F8
MTATTSSKVKQRTSKPSPESSRNLLLTVAFFEGAAVMVIELLGAKIIAPFYGTSLYVWASVLGVTLTALATGYYLGGWLSQKYRTEYPLFLVLGLGAVLTVLAPQIAPSIMVATSDLGVRAGSFIAVLLYLLPPVVCMGTVSPLITQLINSSKDKAGRSAGTVYAVSTVGGILATFLAGFYLIPELGITLTSWLVAGVLFVIAVLGLVRQKRIVPVGALLMGGLIALLLSAQSPTTDSAITVQYQSSGILGEWTVVDQVVAYDNGEPLSTRQLLLNGVDQTYTEVGNEPVSMWLYPHKIAALAGVKPAGSKALLLGMGGGSIAHNLLQLGFDLDIVELDERIPYIAEKWFGYDPNSANLVIDDARHFVNETTEKYDLVIFDLVSGEVQPWHVFTEEGLQDVREVLAEDALVIVNFQGLFDMENPELSRGPRSVLKTFQSVNYDMFISQREEDGTDLSSDLLMYGTPSGGLDFETALQQKLRYDDLFPFEEYTGDDFTPVPDVQLQDALVLTDDKPNLELLNAPTILDWRKNKMKFTVEGMLKKGLPIYY